jgi:hypothetical protein
VVPSPIDNWLIYGLEVEGVGVETWGQDVESTTGRQFLAARPDVFVDLYAPGHGWSASVLP